MLDDEARPRSHLDQRQLRRGDGLLTTEIREERRAPIEEGPSREGSLINRRETPDLYPGFQGVEAGASPSVGSPRGRVRGLLIASGFRGVRAILR